ncbi:MAG: SUMF1/EgtB/PvdO family nonheme iron enzyme [Desulfococcaceae bacterium]|jgi:formylglycine-generating enzyme required for sulfatase activity|nr:SUMF1/EgtB/PvdO family nonheme iron enzyme [Desulfococcaceae bacterium]
MYRKKGKFIYGLAVLIFGITLLSGTNAFGILPGNVDGEDYLDLKDAIMALQVCAGISFPQDPPVVYADADIDESGFIGIAEAVYALQVTAGLRRSTLFIINTDGTALENLNVYGTELEKVQISLLDSSIDIDIDDPVNLRVLLPGYDPVLLTMIKKEVTSYDRYTYAWTGDGDDSVLFVKKDESLSGCIHQAENSYFIQYSDGSYNVSTEAAICEISISPDMAYIETSEEGVSRSFYVTSCCDWTALMSVDEWITVTSVTGDSVAYSVSPSVSPCDAAEGEILVISNDFIDNKPAGYAVFNVERSLVPCDYIFDPAESPVFPFSGGNDIVNIQTDSCCDWTAVSSVPSWLTVTSSGSGTGNGTLAFSITPSSLCEPRMGKITIGNKEFKVTQDGIDCNSSIEISPTGMRFDSSAHEGSITVEAPDCCDWNVVSSAPLWLAVTSGSSGTGNGTVVFSITESMLCESRTGKITIGNKDFTVTQEGIDCSSSISISPNDKIFTSSSAQEGSITVTAPSCCSWTADMSQAPSWLSLTSGNSGTGNGTVSYAISANTSGESRTAKIIIAGIDFTIRQDDSQPEETYTNSLGMTFQYIPAGSFVMGSPESEPGRQGDEIQETVVIENYYYMQTTEVTQAQWMALMGSNPSEFANGGTYPVENVSWSKVKDFITALNARNEGSYRLPTEAEWEYAARAGRDTAFANGNITDTACSDPVLNNIGWYCGNANNATHPVRMKTPNPWKLYDMHGNVWEWCEDASPDKNVHKVIRGGSWFGSAAFARSANKAFSSQFCECHGVTGFRLVREP